MQLPALKNSVPASLVNGMSIEDFIRHSTQNLQRMAAAMPGGSGVTGATYLGFDGTNGVWKLNREPVDVETIGRILVPQHGLFEGFIEWANSSPLQKIQRQLLGVHHDEPMSERLLPKPLSPNAYRKETDGPTHMVGFVGFVLDDGATVSFEKLLEGRQKGGQRPGDDRHSGDRRLRRGRPPGDRARRRLIRERLPNDLRPEAHRGRLRHRQARAGDRCCLLTATSSPARRRRRPSCAAAAARPQPSDDMTCSASAFGRARCFFLGG